jgi:hypothetical protein
MRVDNLHEALRPNKTWRHPHRDRARRLTHRPRGARAPGDPRQSPRLGSRAGGGSSSSNSSRCASTGCRCGATICTSWQRSSSEGRRAHFAAGPPPDQRPQLVESGGQPIEVELEAVGHLPAHGREPIRADPPQQCEPGARRRDRRADRSPYWRYPGAERLASATLIGLGIVLLAEKLLA